MGKRKSAPKKLKPGQVRVTAETEILIKGTLYFLAFVFAVIAVIQAVIRGH